MARRLRLRPWQKHALDRFERFESDDFLAVATPGSGKTTFALVAAISAMRRLQRSRLVIVTPTGHLKSQWAKAAEDLGLHLDDRWNAEQGLAPDFHGLVTTYQQVSSSARAVASLATDGVVVLDEIHHAGGDRTWGTAVLEAFNDADTRIALSGTPFRSDSSAIPFVNYHFGECVPDVEYGYEEALRDGSIVRPVWFPKLNGFMEWVASDGSEHAATFEDDLTIERANQRLRTALSLEGEWLPAALKLGVEQLREVRRGHPNAGGLVIAMDQEHAQGIAGRLAQMTGRKPVVAVSEDPNASRKIAAFADSAEPWIVAVRMVSEGVDIPRLRVAVFATNTTTELFFRQAVGRVVRWTPGIGRQPALFIIPDDPRLRSHAARIAEHRRHSLKDRASKEDTSEQSMDLDSLGPDDEEQLDLFSVIGAVRIETDESDASLLRRAMEVDFNSGDGHLSDPALEVSVLPPPLPPGGSAGASVRIGHDPQPGAVSLRQRRAHLRDANSALVTELRRRSGLDHAAINKQLNELAGVERVTDASVAQLEERLRGAERWLKSLG